MPCNHLICLFFFKSLKDNFAKTFRTLCFEKHNFIITKQDFAKVLKVPFERAEKSADEEVAVPGTSKGKEKLTGSKRPRKIIIESDTSDTDEEIIK